MIYITYSFKMAIIIILFFNLPTFQVQIPDISKSYKNLGIFDTLFHKNILNFPLTLKYRKGDINIGGLFQVYKSSPHQNELCSNELDDYLILKAYAMIFAVEHFSKEFRRLYNISLGYLILPTCSQQATAQLQAIIMRQALVDENIIAIIGPFASTEVSIVSPYLSYYKIPHISPAANFHYFSERNMFSYLFRLTTDQTFYLNAITALFLHFKWNTFAILYSFDPYNSYFAKSLRLQVKKLKACIMVDIGIPEVIDPNYFNNPFVKYQIDELLSHKCPLATVLFLTKQQILEILSYIRKQNKHPRLILIALDTWPGVDELLNSGLEDVAQGAITLFEFSDSVLSFLSWMTNFSNDHVPWYSHWKLLNYRSLNLSLDSKSALRDQTLPYNEIDDMTKYHDSRLSLIIDAVTVVIYALQQVIENKICFPYHSNVSQRIKCLTDNNLHTYIANTSFIGKTGPITFIKGQNIHLMLRVGNFVKINSSPGYGVVTSGTYDTLEDRLTILSDLRWENYTYRNVSAAPPSYCSLPCGGKELKVSSNTPCCWTCVMCDIHQKITQDPVQPCVDCPFGTEAYNFSNECYPIPQIYMTSLKSYTNFIYIINSIALCLVFGLSIYYLINYDTMVFKMEIRSLLYLIFGGVITGIIAIFMITSKPTLITCTVGQFLFLLSFVLIYASSLAKIIIISNKLKVSKTNMGMVRMESRLIYIILAACLIQIMVNVVLIAFEKGDSTVVPNYTGSHHKSVLETYCSVYPTAIYLRVIVMGYQLLLLLISFFYTITLNNLPSNFEEAKLLRRNLCTIIILYIIGLFIYAFVISFLAIIWYQIFYLFILYNVIFCNTFYKLRAQRVHKTTNVVS